MKYNNKWTFLACRSIHVLQFIFSHTEHRSPRLRTLHKPHTSRVIKSPSDSDAKHFIFFFIDFCRNCHRPHSAFSYAGRFDCLIYSKGLFFFYSAHITFVKHIKHSLLHARNSRACLVEWFECSMVVFGLFALIYPSWVWVAILSATLDWVCVCCDFVWLLGVCVTATGMDSIFQSMEPTRTTSYEQHIKYPKNFLLCSIINGNCILSVFGKESSIETLMMS